MDATNRRPVYVPPRSRRSNAVSVDVDRSLVRRRAQSLLEVIDVGVVDDRCELTGRRLRVVDGKRADDAVGVLEPSNVTSVIPRSRRE